LTKEGVRGLFAGFGATALRDAPFAGVYVFFYENLKPYCRQVTSEHLLINMTSGLVGGFMATLVTQPFDMIKTRLQLKPKEYKNMVYAFSKILREETAMGFFSGMIPRVLRKSFSSAISWTVYEEVIKRF
jgi:solute carrier family 25 protein 38